MPSLKLYIAGKMSPNSVFGRHDWRDGFCAELSTLSGFEFINLDPTKSGLEFDLDQNNTPLIVGRNCFMIQTADLVIVNLTDDIGVGGAHEMLIAKYYQKPLVGIAPRDGKFFKTHDEMLGRTYQNLIHPFVAAPCDAVVEDIGGAAEFIKKYFSTSPEPVKSLKFLDEALAYYKNNHYEKDKFLQEISKQKTPMPDVESYLQSHKITYIRHEHPAVFTCEEAEKYCAHVPGLAGKNLLLRNKNSSRFFLLILPAHKRTDPKQFSEISQEKKITFASPETLSEKLQLTPGSVSPFGLINNEPADVEVFIDRELYEADTVNFHPNINTASLELSHEMFQAYLKTLPHKITII